MASPLDHCLDRLHLKDNTRLREKAVHFQAQCQATIPASVFRKGPNSLHVVSIQLAHESLGLHDWDNAVAAELAMCSARDYASIVASVRKQLHVATKVRFETLGVRFGSTALAQQAADLFDAFTEQHVGKLAPASRADARRQFADEGKWKAAMFYACARANGVALDKAMLQSVCSCDAKEFGRSTKLIQAECKEQLSEIKATKPARSRRAKNAGKTPSKEASASSSTTSKASSKKAAAPSTSKKRPADRKKEKELEMSKKLRLTRASIPTMINDQDYRASTRYQDYLNWEKSIRQRMET
ncbi:hypothetical protein BC940DRAFT_306763 [Gongronella butleri]|nr:hypothetical protein BC940DRAFT_306763 [Gongronella butleri]